MANSYFYPVMFEYKLLYMSMIVCLYFMSCNISIFIF